MLKLPLERTEKMLVSDLDYAEQIVEEAKAKTDETLVDYKVSYKETKDSEYYIVVLKFRQMTLGEAKEQM